MKGRLKVSEEKYGVLAIRRKISDTQFNTMNMESYKDMHLSIRLFLCAVSLMYHAADITAFESEASSQIGNLFWWNRFKHVVIVGSICAHMAVVESSFGSSVSTVSITITRQFGASCTNTVCWPKSTARDSFIAARKHEPMRIC